MLAATNNCKNLYRQVGLAKAVPEHMSERKFGKTFVQSVLLVCKITDYERRK